MSRKQNNTTAQSLSPLQTNPAGSDEIPMHRHDRFQSPFWKIPLSNSKIQLATILTQDKTIKTIWERKKHATDKYQDPNIIPDLSSGGLYSSTVLKILMSFLHAKWISGESTLMKFYTSLHEKTCIQLAHNQNWETLHVAYQAQCLLKYKEHSKEIMHHLRRLLHVCLTYRQINKKHRWTGRQTMKKCGRLFKL